MIEQTDWYSISCAEPNRSMQEMAELRQLSLTKPPGSLGRLEKLAVELSAMQGRIDPKLDRIGIAVFAGDHGVAVEGVSAFPQVVTGEMINNFVRGGAAISVLARQTRSELLVVNTGTISRDRFDAPVIDRPVALGTGNIAVEPAMTLSQCIQALAIGKEIMDKHFNEMEMVIGGEMGIANTTSATALAAASGSGDVDSLIGPGTGVDEEGLQRKRNVIYQALKRIDSRSDPLIILADLGGFEIVALVGFYIRAAQLQIPILVDGFISSVAALFACRINLGVREWMLFSHMSAEPGHALVLDSLHADPLLTLDMRLGEGSGAAVAIELLRLGCTLQNEMATFAEASVTDGS